MARILICHVPKDGSLARDLGAALMGRGHYVSFDGEPDAPRPERTLRLRQFETVIVLWTEASAQSPGLADIARETLPLNLLVPVRAEDLDLARLPLAFRKLNMLAPRDVDGIARLVARLSSAAVSLREMAEREAARRSSPPPASPPSAPQPGRAARPPQPAAAPRAAQAPPAAPAVAPRAAVRARPLSGLPEVETGPAPALRREPPPPVPAPPAARAGPAPSLLTAEDLARAVNAGLLVHHIPAAMWLGDPTTVELTLGRDVLAGLAPADPAGPGIETLSVSLFGSAEAFDVERQSERTQFVSPRHVDAGRDPQTVGRWAWLVTPRAAGPQDLVVRVTALLRDRRGVPAPVALPDRRFTVDIQVPEDVGLAAALAGWRRR